MRKGITLIEVLVASLIMLITIGASFYLYVHTQKQLQANRQRVVAQSIFEREFEKVRKLITQDDIKKYLYHNEDTTKPISDTNPLVVVMAGTSYKLYYEVQAGKPYKLVSLGADNNSYLKADKDGGGNEFGAKVIQVSAIITWEKSGGATESMNIIFRGQDAISI